MTPWRDWGIQEVRSLLGMLECDEEIATFCEMFNWNGINFDNALRHQENVSFLFNSSVEEHHIRNAWERIKSCQDRIYYPAWQRYEKAWAEDYYFRAWLRYESAAEKDSLFHAYVRYEKALEEGDSVFQTWLAYQEASQPANRGKNSDQQPAKAELMNLRVPQHVGPAPALHTLHEEKGMEDLFSQHGGNETASQPTTANEAWQQLEQIIRESDEKGVDELKQKHAKAKQLQQQVENARKNDPATTRAPKKELEWHQTEMHTFVMKMDLHKPDILEFVTAHAELLMEHACGSLCLLYYLRSDNANECWQISQRCNVDLLHKMMRDRFGTEIIQHLVTDDNISRDTKYSILKRFNETFMDRKGILYFQDPHANFMFRAYFKASLTSNVGFEFSRPVIEALLHKLEALWTDRSTPNFRIAYKVVMWPMELCAASWHPAAPGLLERLLDWCTRHLHELVNHEYGNLVAQHMALLGTRHEHLPKVMEHCLLALEAYVQMNTLHRDSPFWFFNVICTCLDILADDSKEESHFIEQLLDVLTQSNTFCQRRILDKQRVQRLTGKHKTKFFLRILLEKCDAEIKRQLLSKSELKESDIRGLPARAAYTFTSSLYYQRWTDLGASNVTNHIVADITEETEEMAVLEDAPHQRAYKVRVPWQLENTRLGQIKLEDYGMILFGMESDVDGVTTGLHEHSELKQGHHLWVFFKRHPVRDMLKKFTGSSRTATLQCRELPLQTLQVSKNPGWIGKSLEEAAIEHQFVIGKTDGTQKMEKFPPPQSRMNRKDTLMVLPMNRAKFEDLASGKGMDREEPSHEIRK